MESSTNTAMIAAVRDGNISTVAKLLDEYDLSCNELAGFGYNLLLDAVKRKQSAIAKLLLSKGAKVNFEDSNIIEPTPLHVAVENSEKEIIEILLQKGADINVKADKGECTPLHQAVIDNNIEITELLLQNKAQIDVSNPENKTPLKIAVEKGFVDIVKILLQKGANVNFFGGNFKSPRYRPLHVACEKGYKDIVELLLSSGAEVNAGATDFCTPLHVAVEKGFKEIVEVLVNRGANIAVVSARGLSPLHIAVKKSHKDIVDFLLKLGAPVDVKTIGFIEPLHLAVHKGDVDIIRMLLDNGANINAKEDGLYTPLRVAVDEGRSEIVDLLLRNGADVNAEMNFRTPLHSAIEIGSIDIVQLLLRSGADANAKLDSHTPLHIAAQHNSASGKGLTELLLNNGADVNAKTKDSNTPLHIAIKNNRSDLVQLLLERGADVDSEDKDSNTPLCLAVKKECPIIFNHVLQYRPDVDNKRNQFALSIAIGIQKNKAEIIKGLLKYGFPINPVYATNCDIVTCVIKNGLVEHANEIFKNCTNTTIDLRLTLLGLKPLHVAAIYKKFEIAKVLLKYGADLNVRETASQKTPIHFATANADFNMFQLFLSHGAVVTDPGELLSLAAKSGCLEIVKSLVNYGCDVNCEGERGQTALHNTSFAVERPSTLSGSPWHFRTLRLTADESLAHVQITEYLLQNGANVNACDHDHVTPLLTAARQESNVIAEVLVKNGALVNAADKYGDTVLLSAVRTGCLSLTRLLLNNGANINTKPTPLHIATKADVDVNRVNILQEQVDVNVFSMGEAAIHVASRNNNPSLIKLLLEYGADVNLQCSQGTALHLAARNGHKELVKTLLEYEADLNIVSTENTTPLQCTPHDDPTEGVHSGGSSDYLLDHLVKMAAAGLHVSERNLRYLETESLLTHFPGRPTLPKRLVMLMSNCHEEIQIMKNTTIADSCCTYYDILTRSARRIVSLVGNNTLVQILNEGVYRHVFPIYASMISNRFELAKKRRQLEEESKRVFFYVHIPDLPYMCIDRIVRYLTNGDLMVLIRIFCPPS